MQFGALSLKPCRYGWMLYTGPYIGKCFELYGQYSEAEVAMMRGFIQDGGTVIDVGANIGDLTLPVARMVGEKGSVFAIESHPDPFHVLCGNLALNGIRNTVPINAFVAASDQAQTESPVWGKFAYVSERWAPRFVALDSLELSACDLIKVDVDGNELEVFRSGEMQIERFRPVLYFENDYRDKSPELLSFVMGLGYDVYWHLAPIFDPVNFFNNPENHWAPRNICSLMMVAVPAERKLKMGDLRKVVDKNDWWEEMGSSGSR